jgi:hypothetical protein
MIIAVPDPIIPPVMLCDVETCSPSYVAVKTHVISAGEADKVAYKSRSETTPLPSVLITMCPCKIVLRNTLIVNN